jgi:uncharacterized membrane protein HdeD (DUF308 family)
MTEGQSGNRLSMAVPNGIILGLIGILILITPLATPVPEDKVAMDLIAGLLLICGGAVSLILGLRRRQPLS